METRNVEGVIEKLLEEKGYGFIKVPGYAKSIFFHMKECKGIRFEQLRLHDKVLINQINEDERGLSARNVSLL